MEEITIKDIARICGVGVSTVSRAINNHPDINPDTKEKINQVIKEYGYIPNNSARNLKRQEANVVALLIRGINNPFFLSMIPVMGEESKKRGFIYITQRVEEEEDEIDVALQLEKEKRLKGIIFLGASYMVDPEKLKKLQSPAVFCTLGKLSRVPEKDYSSVSIDDAVESKKITEYLIRRGHKKIALVGGRVGDVSIGELRLNGYKEALAEHGIPFDPILLGHMMTDLDPYSASNGYATMQNILEKRRDFTAVYALSDQMAIGAMRALLDAGIKVPEECSVVGFDGTEYAKYSNPRLTTLKQPSRVLMVKSAELLFDLIEKKCKNEHYILDAELVEGESVISLL